MNQEESFSGFMPMINQISLTREAPMLNTDGELTNAHTFTINTRDGSQYVFSIMNHDLMRLFFLINKAVSEM